MDLTSLIEIVIAILVVYFCIRFIISPVIKAIVGVAVFFVLIYILQKYFGFSIDKVLSPFGISLNTSKWGLNLNWLSGPIDYCINQAESFFHYMWQSIPKNK